MTRKADQAHIDDVIARQYQFLDGKDWTSPWDGGKGTQFPPIGSLQYRLYPEALDRFLEDVAVKITSGQQQQAARAMAIKLSEPGTRASLAQRGTLGRCMAIVDRRLGHGATALSTGETSFLSIERMRVPRHLIEDIRGLGQVARDCPAWLEEMVGNEASRGAVARNTLHFLWMEIHKARKGQPRNIAALVKPKVLEDVSMTLGALLPLCHPEDVDAWLPPACKIAAHLDEHGIGIVLGKIPGTLDQVSDSSEMAQTGLTALRRSSLASIAGQGDEHTSRSRRKI